MPHSPIIPVILAGGKGTRLRPLTSARRPKPLLKLPGQGSLLHETLKRVSSFETPVIICDTNFVPRIKREVSAFSPQIIAEPCQRSTAAALALAAFHVREANPSALMLVTPSDHFIADANMFREAAHGAIPRVEAGEVTMIGAKPSGPSARYGYIQHDRHGRVAQFHEKPDRQTAKRYLKTGGVLWNTGIFIVKPQILLSLLETHAPAIYNAAEKAFKAGKHEGGVLYPHKEFFETAPTLPIDKAVMEKCVNASVLAIQTEWSDVGTWPALISILLRNGLPRRPDASARDVSPQAV